MQLAIYILGILAITAWFLWIDYDTERMRDERESQPWDRDY